MNKLYIHNRLGQRGVAAVEFALIASVFFTLLIGIMEMGRVLFYLNTAAETTRLGARVAVVCDINDTAIKLRMIEMFGTLTTTDIDIDYEPGGCNLNSCRLVTVSINPKQINTFIPFIDFAITMPPFTTTLPRESMDSVNNVVCT